MDERHWGFTPYNMVFYNDHPTKIRMAGICGFLREEVKIFKDLSTCNWDLLGTSRIPPKLLSTPFRELIRSGHVW